MEVEISAEDFVWAFAAEHHFNAHGLDFASQQIHWDCSADGGYVKSFKVVDDVFYGRRILLG